MSSCMHTEVAEPRIHVHHCSIYRRLQMADGGHQPRVFNFSVYLCCTILIKCGWEGTIPFLPSALPLSPLPTTVLLISSCVCNKHRPSSYNERQTNKDKISLQSLRMFAAGQGSRYFARSIKILCIIQADSV